MRLALKEHEVYETRMRNEILVEEEGLTETKKSRYRNPEILPRNSRRLRLPPCALPERNTHYSL